jgi:hypothetical protein
VSTCAFSSSCSSCSHQTTIVSYFLWW